MVTSRTPRGNYMIESALLYTLRFSQWLHKRLLRRRLRRWEQTRAHHRLPDAFRQTGNDALVARRLDLLTRRLGRIGYHSLSELADRHPWATMASLGQQLQLEPQDYGLVLWGLQREAESGDQIEAFIRDQLVRYVNADRNREPASSIGSAPITSLFESGILRLAAVLPKYRSHCYRVAAAYSESRLPVTWRPAHRNDPTLVALFGAFFRGAMTP